MIYPHFRRGKQIDSKGKFTLVVHKLSYNEIINVVYNIVLLSFERKSTLVVSELCVKNHNPTVI